MKLKTEIEKIKPGDKLIVKATDPGFMKDVKAWANVTGNELINVDMQNGIIKAEIEKRIKETPPTYYGNSENVTLIVFDDDLDRAIASFVIANGALAMGKKVTMFFTFWGLSILKKYKKPHGIKKNLIERMFGWMLPSNSKKLKLSKMNMFGIGPKMIRGLMKHKHIDSLEEMITSAINNGAEIVACQMSMDLMGIKKEELIDGVKVGGVATYLSSAGEANTNLFI